MIDGSVYGHAFPLLLLRTEGRQANGVMNKGGIDRCVRQ